MKTTLSLSGGKDSTFLLLELIRRGTPPDECVFFDTGWEFPQMYRHMDRLRALCEENGIEFTVLHPAKSFDYLMFEKPVREKTGGTHCGYSWCGARGIRWGTTEKTKALDQHNKGNIVLIGIAADEPDRLTKERAPGKTFPLAERGITEAECLAGCYAAGYDWEGLYEKLDRVSCACCAAKNLKGAQEYLQRYARGMGRPSGQTVQNLTAVQRPREKRGRSGDPLRAREGIHSRRAERHEPRLLHLSRRPPEAARRWNRMTAKCVGCGLDWNVSIYQKIPRTGYICPHCESRLRAGETLPNIQASQKARPQRTKGATP